MFYNSTHLPIEQNFWKKLLLDMLGKIGCVVCTVYVVCTVCVVWWPAFGSCRCVMCIRLFTGGVKDTWLSTPLIKPNWTVVLWISILLVAQVHCFVLFLLYRICAEGFRTIDIDWCEEKLHMVGKYFVYLLNCTASVVQRWNF